MNEDQVDQWNGPEANHWCDNADRYDAQLEPFLRAIDLTVGADELGDVLDVGCGCGALTLALATRAVSAVGADISAPLLAVADDRRTKQGFDNAGFVIADVQSWEPASQFDLIVSRFGVMFFDDPVAALTNLRRMLKPNGRLTFVCWQGLSQQQWLLEPGVAAADFLPPGPPPVSGPGMFSLSDPVALRELLISSGFTTVDIQDHRTPMYIGGPGSVAEASRFFAGGSIARTMLEHANPDDRRRAIEAVTNVFAEYHDGTGVRFDTATWLVTATG